MGPYGDVAWWYWTAGWRGVLPLPARAKTPPPGGFTGWAGIDPSGADVQAWCDGPEAAGNVALRLPLGVYGLDVDDYAGKHGGAALAALEAAHGPLPATWVVSSRDDGVSGIRLYRAELEPGRRWRDEPAGHGAGIEAIHRGHRYAVVWPSVHPETGRKYVWRRPDGIVADGDVPAPHDLPEMPPAHVEALSEPGEVRSGDLAGHDETVGVVTGWREGGPCPRVALAFERAMGGLSAGAAGAALHPAMLAGVHELVNLGHEGHAGARRALAEHYAGHLAAREARNEGGGAAAEWWRAVRGAIGKLPGDARAVCDCGLWSGEGLLFEPDGPLEGFGHTGGERTSAGQGADGLIDSPESPTMPDSSYIKSVAEPPDLAALMLGRMLGPAELRAQPAPTPLIEGLLTLDSASWLIAAPGSYKSFLALDWAAHVAAGRAWLGRGVARGPVVYMVAEGIAGMGPRIRAWEQWHGSMSDDVRFLPLPIQVAREEHWAALIEACTRIAPAMIILDTQARITLGFDENDNTAMGQVVEAFDKLKRATRACVLAVHHLGRSGQHARGASAIDGAQDTELRLTRTAERRAVLEIDKSKHGADDARVELELYVVELDGGGSSLVVGAPLGGPAAPDWRANLTLNQLTLVSVMSDIFPGVGATKAELKAEVRKRVRHTLAGDAAIEPMGDSAFRRAWDSLVTSGRFVRVSGAQRYLINSEPATVDEVSE